MLRAGLTPVPVRAMPTRWTKTRVTPMARPAIASRATFDVANKMTITKMKVRMASTAKALPTPRWIFDALP